MAPVKRNTLIFVAIALLVLLGIVIFFLTRGSSSNTSSPTQTMEPTTIESNTPASGMQSLRSLLGFSTSQMCKFSDDETGSSGNIYVSSGKMRGDFATVVNGQATSSHMYSDGQTMYIWVEGADIGYKNSLSAMESITPIPETGPASQATFDIDQQIDYQCQDWSVDESMFQLPSGVEFRDLSLMMQEIPDAMTDDSQDKCSACDSLSGEAKTQCLTALGC